MVFDVSNIGLLSLQLFRMVMLILIPLHFEFSDESLYDEYLLLNCIDYVPASLPLSSLCDETSRDLQSASHMVSSIVDLTFVYHLVLRFSYACLHYVIYCSQNKVAIRLTDRDGVLVTSPLAGDFSSYGEDQISKEEAKLDIITMQVNNINYFPFQNVIILSEFSDSNRRKQRFILKRHYLALWELQVNTTLWLVLAAF